MGWQWGQGPWKHFPYVQVSDVLCYIPIPIIYRTSLLQNFLKLIIGVFVIVKCGWFEKFLESLQKSLLVQINSHIITSHPSWVNTCSISALGEELWCRHLSIPMYLFFKMVRTEIRAAIKYFVKNIWKQTKCMLIF